MKKFWKKDIDNEVLTFVVFAIESAAEKLGVSSVEFFNRMERIGLIQPILVEGYETLHTQSKEYIADAVIEALNNWEDYYAQKGGQR